MSTELDDMERRLLELGRQERQFEESLHTIGQLIVELRQSGNNNDADGLADRREEIRLALKQLKALIADFEVRYYTAVRRLRRK